MNILFFLPSVDWGYRERLALKTILLLEKEKKTCILLCKKNSAVFVIAKKYNIHIVLMISKTSASMFPGELYWHYKKILREYEINTVHLFSLEHYFTFWWCLKSFRLISLFLSIVYEHQVQNWLMFKNVLLLRADGIFVSNKAMENDIVTTFDLHRRKIINHGMFSTLEGIKILQRGDIESDCLNLSLFIDNYSSLLLYQSFFLSLKRLSSKIYNTKLIKIHMVYDSLNIESSKFEKIKKMFFEACRGTSINVYIEYLAVDILTELSSDCHIVLEKTIIDEIAFLFFNTRLPLIVPRGSQFFVEMLELDFSFWRFYKEQDMYALIMQIVEFNNQKEQDTSSSHMAVKNFSAVEVGMRASHNYKTILLKKYDAAKAKRFRKFNTMS